jgi:hypothetical protein
MTPFWFRRQVYLIPDGWTRWNCGGYTFMRTLDGIRRAA